MDSAMEASEDIFAQAIEIASTFERTRYLDSACGDRVGLRREVGRLVDDYFRSENFLSSPPLAALAALTEAAEQPGDLVDRYKLVSLLGDGGMGVVYLAEQIHPVVRHVALKIIKPGMDTRQVIARFAAERQALAVMDHPNIARALDAGTTDSGRPYFVMDLVHGAPITNYCDAHRLTLRERLELFVPVCQAVQHAHQKGVIHRDLKPSNVLVAEYDGRPTPKIIDFGVAKAIGDELAERTSYTRVDQLIGTVDYMSPEQAAFHHGDVDTRSDVYSLGALLYELLVGATPLKQRRVQGAAFDELLRTIREDDPPRPSACVAASADLLTIAQRRRVEPDRLAGALRGDLDWIVMKALEKDRTRRYETASELAADVQHYLADEPVKAVEPSATYRIGKFVRRNKATAIGGLVVVGGLIAGMIGTSIALVSQSRQRAIAERERAEVQLNYAVALQSQRRYAEAEALYRRGLKIPVGGTLADRQRLAVTRLRLAETVDDRSGPKESTPLFRHALAAYREAFPLGDPNIAHALSSLAERLRTQQQFAEAEELFREAYNLRRSARPVDHRAIGESAAQLTNVLITLGRYADAEPIARAAIAEHELAEPKDQWALALARLELGRDLVSMQQFTEAEVQFLEANRVLDAYDTFQAGQLALAALYTCWNEAQPGQGYDAKARAWIRRLIGSFVRLEPTDDRSIREPDFFPSADDDAADK